MPKLPNIRETFEGDEDYMYRAVNIVFDVFPERYNFMNSERYQIGHVMMRNVLQDFGDWGYDGMNTDLFSGEFYLYCLTPAELLIDGSRCEVCDVWRDDLFNYYMLAKDTVDGSYRVDINHGLLSQTSLTFDHLPERDEVEYAYYDKVVARNTDLQEAEYDSDGKIVFNGTGTSTEQPAAESSITTPEAVPYDKNTYDIEIKETLSKVVKVEADTPEEALEKAEEGYRDEKYILEAEDIVDTEFIPVDKGRDRNAFSEKLTPNGFDKLIGTKVENEELMQQTLDVYEHLSNFKGDDCCIAIDSGIFNSIIEGYLRKYIDINIEYGTKEQRLALLDIRGSLERDVNTLLNTVSAKEAREYSSNYPKTPRMYQQYIENNDHPAFHRPGGQEL